MLDGCVRGIRGGPRVGGASSPCSSSSATVRLAGSFVGTMVVRLGRSSLVTVADGRKLLPHATHSMTVPILWTEMGIACSQCGQLRRSPTDLGGGNVVSPSSSTVSNSGGCLSMRVFLFPHRRHSLI